MFGWVVLFAGVLGGAIALAFWNINRAWHAIARELGTTLQREAGTRSLRIDAWLSGYRLSVVGGADSPTVIEVLVPKLAPDDEALRTAAMDTPTRERHVRFSEVQLEAGAVTLVWQPEAHRVAPRIEVIENAVALARAFDLGPREVAEKLSDNVVTDPDPAVALASWATLRRDHPERVAATAAAAFTAAQAEAVRAACAPECGPVGVDYLRQMVATHEDPQVVAQAFAALGHTDVAASRFDLAADRLTAKGTPKKVAIALLEGLGGVADPRTEGILLSALDQGTPFVRYAAAEALGKRGTLAAIGPLAEARDATFAGDKMQALAADAIGRIQARAGADRPGALSLAAPVDAQGRLALAAEQRAYEASEEE